MSITTDVRVAQEVARKVAAVCGVAVLLVAATACGSDQNNANATGNTGENGPQVRQTGPDGKMPGAIGKVAAVDGSTAQVQGMQDGQVAVTWTASTTFTKQVSATLSDVKVGDCVLVGSADQGSTGSTTPPAKVTAATVRITQKTNGSCGIGRPGGADGSSGSGPQLNGQPPSGAPSPGAGGRPQVRGFGGAVGEVTAVSGTGFTVASVTPGSQDRTTVDVTVGSTTTYTTTAPGAASDVKVGTCVQADGDTDDTGAVTATRIAVSPPEDGQCGGVMRFNSGNGSGSTGQES